MKPYQVAVAVGVILGLLLLIVAVISLFSHICYVWQSGHSLYIGNGVFEYGYGWGWIRRRMFHHGGVPSLGWTIQRPLPSLVGVIPKIPGVHVSLWLAFLVDVALTTLIYYRKRIFDPPPHRYLVALLLWGSVEVILAIFLVPPTGAPRFVMYAAAISTVIVPVAIVRYLRNRVAPPGFCRICRYNLTGNVSGRCPECGTEISGRES